MDDSGWSSLPPNLEAPEGNIPRPEPDGAVSSTDSSPSFLAKANRKKGVGKSYAVGQTSSDSSEENIAKAPVTQILSEYRQPQREYKEFRTSTRHHSDHFDTPRQTTVHPQVTCNMPKTRGNCEIKKSLRWLAYLIFSLQVHQEQQEVRIIEKISLMA